MTWLLRSQLLAIRQNAQAILAMADAVLAVVETPVAAAAVSSGPCQHPPERRLSAPRMGAPEAWVCMCGVESPAPDLAEATP